MGELEHSRPGAVARAEGEGAGGALTVYAAATGLAAAVPVPLLDGMLGGLARGAAMRRVAARRGVRLTREAREVLARTGAADPSEARRLHLARQLVSRVVAPLRIASRLEDALEAFAAGMLLDHYLASSARRGGAPLQVDEARRLRRAIDRAAADGTLETVRRLPLTSWRALSDAVRAAATLDDEDRTPAERLVDTLLDAFADAQGAMVSQMRERFDAALSEAGADVKGDGERS